MGLNVNNGDLSLKRVYVMLETFREYLELKWDFSFQNTKYFRIFFKCI